MASSDGWRKTINLTVFIEPDIMNRARKSIHATWNVNRGMRCDMLENPKNIKEKFWDRFQIIVWKIYFFQSKMVIKWTHKPTFRFEHCCLADECELFWCLNVKYKYYTCFCASVWLKQDRTSIVVHPKPWIISIREALNLDQSNQKGLMGLPLPTMA